MGDWWRRFAHRSERPPRGLDLVWWGFRAAAGGNQSSVLPSVKLFVDKKREERTNFPLFAVLTNWATILGHYKPTERQHLHQQPLRVDPGDGAAGLLALDDGLPRLQDRGVVVGPVETDAAAERLAVEQLQKGRAGEVGAIVPRPHTPRRAR